MTLTDVEAVRRQRRRTWITGGALLVLSSIAYVLGSGVLLFTSPLIMTLLAAGLIVLAIGLGHGGSVTAHRPMGTGAIIALAVMLVLKPLMFVVVMKVSYANEIDSDARNRANTLSTTITLVLLAVLLALAIVAAVQVARSGDVPRPWNWAPCWSLVAIVATQGEALIHFPLSVAAEAVFTTPSGVNGLVQTLAVAFLGVVAIVLGIRQARVEQREPAIPTVDLETSSEP